MAKSRELYSDHSKVQLMDSGVVNEVNSDALHTLQTFIDSQANWTRA